MLIIQVKQNFEAEKTLTASITLKKFIVLKEICLTGRLSHAVIFAGYSTEVTNK